MMKSKNDSRRRFLKNALGAAGLLAADKLLAFENIQTEIQGNQYDAKGLPTAVLGKTGVRIPRIALGLGSRFCTIKSTQDAVDLLNYALDNGLYYWDTAHIYENKDLNVVSEERLGMVVKSRRKEIFLSTKVSERKPDEAMRQIELSLRRLQTDHLDILKIHDIQVADIETLKKKGSVLDVLQKMKEQKVTRFIGFSGHSEAVAMKAMADTGVFDTMLMAMNHWAGNTEKRQETAIPAAKKQGMGVMLMKVVRPRENNKSLAPEDLVRYALSLPGPDGIVLGTDSLQVLKSNLQILRNFTPLDDAKMKQLAFDLRSYYNHENLPWMQHGYHDGYWA